MKKITIMLAICAALLTGVLLTDRFTARTQAQFSPPAAVEFVQLQPFKTLLPEQTAYAKVGTVGTNELIPCIAATKVWNTDLNAPVNVYVTCRIQADGYAYVAVTNRGTQNVGIYDKIRVVVYK